jgi:hypothetical protein
LIMLGCSRSAAVCRRCSIACCESLNTGSIEAAG